MLALASGIGACSVMRGYAAQLEALRPAVGASVPVVEATRDVARGSVLGAEDVALVSVPQTFVPPVALQEPADALGRVTLTDLAAGELVTATRISAGGVGPLAALVPPGLRAVSVSIASPLPGLAPGDRVDVIASVGRGRSYADTVADGLEVLRPPDAAGTSFGAGPGTTVILLADPDTAERLARAGGYASLSLAVMGEDPSAFSAPDQEPGGG